jgi:hypothetical protein
LQRARRSATKIVAANDSIDKTRADYICDGTDDDVQIQEAIDALGSTGGKVVLLEGTYNITSSVEPTSNCILEGMGTKTILKWNTTGGGLTKLLTNSDHTNGNSKITLRNLCLKPNDGTNYAHYAFYFKNVTELTIEGCLILEPEESGGNDLMEVTKVFVRNNIFDMSRKGLALNVFDDSHEIHITDNIFNQPYDSCISIGATATGKPQNDSIVIMGNTFIKAGADLDIGFGVELFRNTKYAIIANNTFYDISSDGIRVNIQEAETPEYIVIANNNIYNTGREGIFTEAPHTTIIGNVLDTIDNYGIVIWGADCICEGNIIRNADITAIRLDSQDRSRIVNNLIEGPDTQIGIYGNGIEESLIAFNRINIAGYAGIDIREGKNLTITGNIIKNAGQLADATYDDGIRLNDVTQSIISNNRCFDDQATKTQDIGIKELGASDYNTYKGNNLRGNKTAGIETVGAHNTYDGEFNSSILDLSGTASDVEVFHARKPCILVGYVILYTEASSVDAGVTLRVGRYQDGVALDDDYFDTSISEVSKSKGYTKQFVSADLTKSVLAAGDTVTVGSAGGKTGTGEVMFILQIVEMAD